VTAIALVGATGPLWSMPLSAIPERHAAGAELRVVSDILPLIDTTQPRSRGYTHTGQIIPICATASANSSHLQPVHNGGAVHLAGWRVWMGGERVVDGRSDRIQGQRHGIFGPLCDVCSGWETPAFLIGPEAGGRVAGCRSLRLHPPGG
jgi:hypothetical protein